jgi:quinolinate synthase
MFGHDVVERVKREHADAFVTAHLEVPGEMFAIGLEAQREGRGVVGSTSDILRFIGTTVEAAATEKRGGTLAFVLGTEAGMVTPIVRRVRELLATHDARDLAVDIVFPVASEAIAKTGESDLAVVPGVAAGEGCSTAGGCATCPYMKMSSLRALDALLDRLTAAPNDVLRAFIPTRSTEMGGDEASLGTKPILAMRAFQTSGRLSETLVAAVRAHSGNVSTAIGS